MTAFFVVSARSASWTSAGEASGWSARYFAAAHTQGFLAEWASPESSFDTPHDEHLAKMGGEIARELGKLADRLEKELGSWRG